jgi:chromatin remodeling complex protein RSC6
MTEELCKDITETYGTMYESLNKIKADIKEMEKKMKTDEKRLIKSIKGFKPTRHGSKTLTGFAKPGKISEELSVFMGKENLEDLVSRTEATQFIIKYIKDNGLSEGQKIQLNDELCKILDLTPDTEVSFFSLQKYMSRHFIKEQ